LPAGYGDVLRRIKQRIRAAQYEALRAVNKEQVALYWDIGGREYFIDLLLYHRALRCLFAVELKVGEFEPETVGKMQFYLAALDDRVRLAGEKPSIGLILCRTKNRAIVEYALRESRKPIGVSSYQIVRRLPKSLARELPEPGQVRRLLMSLDVRKMAPV